MSSENDASPADAVHPNGQRRFTGGAAATLLATSAVLLAVHLAGAQSHETTLSPDLLGPAIEAQRAIVSASPSSSGGHKDLGNLLALSGDRAAAEDAYRRALDLDPTDAGTYYDLALLISADEPREGVELLQAALEHDPQSAWAHYALGNLRQQLGRRRAAIRSFTAAFTLDPELALPDINPQVITNPDATAALLRAKPPLPQAATPRDYDDPARIAGLLTTEGAAPKEHEEPDQSTSGDAAVSTTPASTTGETRPPGAPSRRAEPEGSTVTNQGQESESVQPGATDSSRSAPKSIGVPSQARRAIGTQDVTNTRSINQATPQPSPTPGGRSPGRAQDPRAPGSTQTPGLRFRPGRRSSARLHLDLLPAAADRVGTFAAGGH